MKDAETGDLIWVDTSSKKVRRNYEKWWNDTSIRQKEIFSKAGVDSVAVRTDEDYVRPLMKLFKKR